MDEKLKEILAQKLSTHECAVPDACWDAVSSQIAPKPTGWGMHSKWLLSAGAVVGAIAIGFVTLTKEGEQEKSATEVPVSVITGEPENAEPPRETLLESNTSTNDSIRTTTEIFTQTHAQKDPKEQSLKTAGIASDGEQSKQSRKEFIETTVEREEQQVIDFAQAANHQEIVATASQAEPVFSVVNAGDMRFLFIPSETEADEYRWALGDGAGSTDMSPEHVYEEPGIYEVTLEIKTASGRKRIQKTVECYPPAKLIVPTIFTPNGDGKNDYFDAMELSSYVRLKAIRIYDAAGRLVYHSSDGSPWSGSDMEGNEAPVGTYLVEIQGEDLRQQKVEKRTHLFLQR